MVIKTRERIDSQVLEGVSFVTRKMTVAVRDAIQEMTAKHQTAAREVWQRFDEANSEPDGPERDFKVLSIRAEMQAIEEQKAHEEIRAGLVKIIGLEAEIDENGTLVPVTDADAMFQYAPTEFAREVHAAVRKSLGITVEEAKNFGSPSTSNAVEGGETTPITAFNASTKDGTEEETAESSFPRT